MGQIIMRVAAIQMVSSRDADENYSTARSLLREAVAQEAQIALLPETFLSYGNRTKPSISEQKIFIAELAHLASDLGVWIIAGTYPLHASILREYIAVKDADKPYAASFVFDNMGSIRDIYLKIHLFDADINDSHNTYRESHEYAQGYETCVADSPWCKFGLAVCYDLRFPELFTRLTLDGAKAIFIPSAFTAVTGRAHWEVLLRARAIESQCFVVASNQGGLHDNDRETLGESMIVNPWGNIVSKLGKGSGVLVEDLDLNMVDEIRCNMPINSHRRFL